MQVLVAVDGSKYSDAAVSAVAGRIHTPESEVRVLHVIEPLPISPDGQVWGYALGATFGSYGTKAI
jgi:hypothetical protein